MTALQPIRNKLINHPVYKELALDDRWDPADMWGSAMEQGFSLCDFLTFVLGRRDVIPAGLGYNPAPGGYPDGEGELINDVKEMWPESGLTPEQVGEYLTILDDFLDVCITLKLDY